MTDAVSGSGQDMWIEPQAAAGGDTDDGQALLAGAWPRFWARWIDVTWVTISLAFALGLVFPAIFSAPVFATRIGDILAGIALLPLALVADACLLSTWGRSPGKVIAGLAVRDRSGAPPSLDAALARNLRLYVRGYMLGVPILNLVGMIAAHHAVVANGTTSWDEESDTYVVLTGDAARTALAAAVAVALQFASRLWAAVA